MNAALAVPMTEKNDGRFKQGNTLWFNNGAGRPEKWTQEVLEQLAYKLIKWTERPESIYLKTFCYENGFLAQQAEEFCQKSPVFSEAWLAAREWQEQKLVVQALKRKTSDNMTKFVLANVHKWKERSELSGDANNPLAMVLDKIARKNQEPIEVIEPIQDKIDTTQDKPSNP